MDDMRIVLASGAMIATVVTQAWSTDHSQTQSSAVISKDAATPDVQDWGTFFTYFAGPSHGVSDGLTGVAEIKPGEKIHPPHRHADEEYLMVLEGEGTWSLNGDDFPAKSGDILYAAPWDVHGIRNTGDETLKFAVFKWSSLGVEAPERRVQHIGVQLYTLRELMEEDFEGTLRRVAALGYKEVETASLFGRDPKNVRALLDELGLQVPAAHIHSSEFIADPDAAIAQAVDLGAEYVILAWMPPEQRSTLAQWEDWADWMNEVGAKAKKAGLTFAYHNHEFEFEPIDGVIPYDIILERTDPDLVSFELDFYWAALAGVDIPALVTAHPGRFVLAHIKDLELDDNSMVNVGQGDLDFATLIAAAEDAGMTYFIVEHDNPTDAILSIQQGLQHLQDLTY